MPLQGNQLINRKRRHIGIRIFIRIIYYSINRHPDSKLSVLSIPISDTKHRVPLQLRS